jgi:hypothetical protein
VATRKSESGAVSVGWKWVAGILTSILILGGGAWMTSVSSDGKDLRIELAQLKKEVADKAADLKLIQQSVESIKESQKRQEAQQEKASDKLDKLKELLQDEKYRGRSRAN